MIRIANMDDLDALVERGLHGARVMGNRIRHALAVGCATLLLTSGCMEAPGGRGKGDAAASPAGAQDDRSDRGFDGVDTLVQTLWTTFSSLDNTLPSASRLKTLSAYLPPGYRFACQEEPGDLCFAASGEGNAKEISYHRTFAGGSTPEISFRSLANPGMLYSLMWSRDAGLDDTQLDQATLAIVVEGRLRNAACEVGDRSGLGPSTLTPWSDIWAGFVAGPFGSLRGADGLPLLASLDLSWDSLRGNAVLETTLGSALVRRTEFIRPAEGDCYTHVVWPPRPNDS